MKFALEFAETYPHPVETVWRALTDRAALAAWLMDNDFNPQRGSRFHMWCDDGAGHTDTYNCEVLVSEPPRRMVWSWVLAGREAAGATTVEFLLTAVDEGTRLTVRHTGDRDPDTIEAFKSGWPEKLRQLRRTIQPDPAAAD